MSTEGCETEPLAPPDTPAPVEAGGVTTDPPPVMPVEPLTPPLDVPAPTDAPAPAEPDVWAWAIETPDGDRRQPPGGWIDNLPPLRAQLSGVLAEFVA